MMAERALSPEEVWLQDSEARLESMEILLKSVRRDIDALSEKIPSPRSGAHSTFHQGETIIHESGSKRYVMEMERGSRGLHNLGLGSHTAFEPFDNEEEAEKPGREPHPHKSWRSPSDFRQDESPPGSPTFGESSNIISLHDVILHSENVTPSPQEDASRTIPLLGSQHSLPTIEENSQEDNLLTDTDTSSISTNDELKSADCAYEHRSQTAVSCARSCDTVVVAADAGQSDNSASKRPLEETMILRREHGRRQQPPSDRPRSGSPFLSNSDSFRFSHTSLRSRDSIVSDTDSYMTVNSQLFPSGEEVYVTACSDNDTPGDSPDDGRTLVRGRTRQKLLILQQTTPSECYNQSDDVLEFTLVEAPACETPTAEKEVESAHLGKSLHVTNIEASDD
ncbi:unnamed protein product [Mesocestoides corti]|uniref:CAP-Gly domain-containing protein n=1 Tax=Mesocestoides corti TaxID=53468 RepID=A0A0R3UKV1_MESCO|nr:unnamed protein product [Mesocestoides corti]